MQNASVLLASHIAQAQHILLVAHQWPDHDTIGACCALREILINQGKRVNMFCVDPVPAASAWLPCANVFRDDVALLREARHDLIITLDIADPRMVGVADDWLGRGVPVVNIDHHITNTQFGDTQIVFPDASSTCEIVALLSVAAGWQMPASAATSLLHGIMGDTGLFSNGATSATSLRVASDLLTAGAHYAQVVGSMTQEISLKKLSLWGNAFTRLRRDEDTRVAITCVRKRDWEDIDADDSLADGIANFLNGLHDSDIMIVCRETADGSLKMSIRTMRDAIDVAAIAKLFGGGGHKKAAGFSLDGHIVEELDSWRIACDNKEYEALLAAPWKELRRLAER